MELSDNQNYAKYMSLFADRNYESAVEALAKCLEDFRGDNIKESFLLKLMADTYFFTGKVEKSVEYYSMSEAADAESLQPKLFFAEFLAKRLRKYEEAIKKCKEISDLADKNPFEETEEDFGSDYYASKAEEIRSFSEMQIAADQ
jgi:tetratricopeptide (TPR) repeat protein